MSGRFIVSLLCTAQACIIASTTFCASAFSTAPHLDMTRRGLQQSNFSASAIAFLQIANHQVDYQVNYSLAFADMVKARAQSVRYHFDDIPDAVFAKRSFLWIEKVAKAVVDEEIAKATPDPEVIANALGIVLHVVQDFYGHSNFSDINWKAITGRQVVIFEELSDDVRLNPALQIRTGDTSAFHDSKARIPGRDDITPRCEESNPTKGCWAQHGGSDTVKSFKLCDGNESSATCGQSRDWHMRRGYFVAEQMGAASTHHWAERFHKWVKNEAVWSQVKNFSSSVTADCMERTELFNRFTGQWGRLGTPAVMAIAFDTMWTGFNEARCDEDWQDRWRKKAFFKMDQVAADVVNVSLPSRGKYSGGFGTFEVLFGTEKATLVLESDAGKTVKGTLTIGGKSKPLSIDHLDGPGFDFSTGKAWNGRIFGMNHAKDSVAGYLRDESGKVNGFYGLLKK